MSETLKVGTLSYEMRLETKAYKAALKGVADDAKAMARNASSAFSSLDGSAKKSGSTLGSAFNSGTSAAKRDFDALETHGKKTFNNIEGEAKKSSGRMKGVLGAGLAVGAVGVTAALGGLVAGIKSSVTAASDQEQAFGAVDQILGKNSKTVKDWAAKQWTIGLSTTEASNSVVYMTQMLMNNGMAADEATTKGMKLTELGADMAATFGGKTVDAVDALSAALRGETDPIERFGVSMKESSIEAYALSAGLQKADVNMNKVEEARANLLKVEENYRKVSKDAKSTEADKAKASAALGTAEERLTTALEGKVPKLNAATKAQAVYGLIMEQTSKYQGQATREGKTYEGQLGRLKAQWTNLKANAGQAFLPTIVEGMVKLNAAMPALSAVVSANVPKIKKFLQDVFNAVKANWPQIVDTAKTFGDALKRTAGFAKIMWDAFNALPPEVKTTLATLLILQKTGVLKVGLQITDLGKLLLQKLGMMKINAGAVYVNGKTIGDGVPGSKPGATPPGGKPGGLPSKLVPAASFFGSVVLVPAAVTAIAAAIGFGFDRWVKAGEKRQETGGNTATAGGTWGAMGGGGSGWRKPGTATQEETQKLQKQAEDEKKSINDRRVALMKLVGAYQAQIASVRASGASTDRVRAAQDIQRKTLADLAKKLGLNKGETDKLLASYNATADGVNLFTVGLEKIPPKKYTTISAPTQQAMTNVLSVSQAINNIPKNVPVTVNAHTESAWDKIKNFFAGFANMIAENIPVGGAVYKIAKNIFGFANGGYVTGPGTGTSDSIPARLSHGEYVVRADAVRRIGVNALDSINQGYASGGYVSGASGMSIGSVTVVAQDTSKFEREMRTKQRAASLSGRR